MTEKHCGYDGWCDELKAEIAMGSMVEKQPIEATVGFVEPLYDDIKWQAQGVTLNNGGDVLLTACPHCNADMIQFAVDPVVFEAQTALGRMSKLQPLLHARYLERYFASTTAKHPSVKELWRYHGQRRKAAVVCVWLDDERPCPEGWLWVKTPGECIDIIREGYVGAVSLDHDLQLKPDDGSREPKGKDVLDWLECELSCGMLSVHDIPLVRIHTANCVGGFGAMTISRERINQDLRKGNSARLSVERIDDKTPAWILHELTESKLRWLDVLFPSKE